MGKKNPEEMAKQRDRFVKGALERSFPEKKIVKIFDLMEQFAGYGFNKSHSAAYGLVSYQTAYLKTHYPVEFMAGLLTSVAGVFLDASLRLVAFGGRFMVLGKTDLGDPQQM